MGRSHAWVQRGQEDVESRPTNWGDNLTLMGAMRADRWVTLGTCWRAMTTATFDRWVKRRLVPQLRAGDVVLLDNLRAHKSATAQRLIEACGARLQFLPP